MGAEGPLRIAQIAPLWAQIPPHSYGGIELTVNLLVEELVARGHDVTLFASADCTTSARLEGVCEEHLLALMADQRAYTAEYYFNAVVAEALKKSRDFDVLHFHTGGQTIPLGSLSAAPTVFTLHTAFSVDDQWVLERYPGVQAAAISRSQVSEMKSPPPVIYNGCDFDAYRPRFEPGSYLAFLGRMSKYKNPLGAIEIAAGVGMPLVLAGEPADHIEREYFERVIVPRIDGRKVRYIGAVAHPEKNELLRNAAALIFPIQWVEPFGLVMIEAMACGTPVLGMRLGSVSEVIDEGITGFSGESMAELGVLLPKVLALDRRRVQEHARERFHFKKMVDNYERLYRELVRRNSSR